MNIKAEDVLTAALACGAIVAVAIVAKRAGMAGAAAARSSAPRVGSWWSMSPAAEANAGGPYAGGSYFTPEEQAVWAVPDNQLPGWADL